MTSTSANHSIVAAAAKIGGPTTHRITTDQRLTPRGVLRLLMIDGLSQSGIESGDGRSGVT
jgi:hypothetical protein